MFGGWIFQVSLFLTILTMLAVIFGEYMAKVFSGKRVFLSPFLRPIECSLYKIFGIDAEDEMDWKSYAGSLIAFAVVGMIFLFSLLELQGFLPLNPQKFGALRWDTALNVAISYVTNTNWQSFKGEASMSYLSQMLGLGVQNFLSAAAGIAIASAIIRTFIRKNTVNIGNFWVDLTRALIYILLPLALVLSLFLTSQGVIDNFHPYVHAQTLEGKEQVIAQGPVASQEAIKLLGTNGGGFFSANSAHPYENPTPLTDYLEIMSLMLIAAAFPFAFGALVGNRKQGWALYLAMLTLFSLGLLAMMWSEAHGNPLLAKLGVHHGANMEGKEWRFGILSSLFYAHAGTATSAGAVNSALDSFMPLSGLVLIFNMAIGETIFGGAGSGFIVIMSYAMLTMFLIGLMVGRSPEIYGKKLEPFEMVMVVIALILPCVMQLILSAVAAYTASGKAGLGNLGPHGLSEIVYAFASTIGNNGSAFAGIRDNTLFYNLITGSAMLVGRAAILLPSLAIAGSLVQKKLNPPSVRFPTASPIFIVVLIGIVVVVGSLTFFPVLVLGPLLEHLFINVGQIF